MPGSTRQASASLQLDRVTCETTSTSLSLPGVLYESLIIGVTLPFSSADTNDHRPETFAYRSSYLPHALEAHVSEYASPMSVPYTDNLTAFTGEGSDGSSRTVYHSSVIGLRDSRSIRVCPRNLRMISHMRSYSYL